MPARRRIDRERFPPLSVARVGLPLILSMPPARFAIERPRRTAVSFFRCVLSGLFLPSRWTVQPSGELRTTYDFFGIRASCWLRSWRRGAVYAIDCREGALKRKLARRERGPNGQRLGNSCATRPPGSRSLNRKKKSHPLARPRGALLRALQAPETGVTSRTARCEWKFDLLNERAVPICQDLRQRRALGRVAGVHLVMLSKVHMKGPEPRPRACRPPTVRVRRVASARSPGTAGARRWAVDSSPSGRGSP